MKYDAGKGEIALSDVSKWFGGNKDGVDLYNHCVVLSHIWDDLVDKDVDVAKSDVNKAFLTALVLLPSNPLYRIIQGDIIPMWMTVVMAYDVANGFEESKDDHGIEIAHSLRYAAGHIIAYAMIACIGRDEASKFLPEMWKDIFSERFEDYKTEHLKEV